MKKIFARAFLLSIVGAAFYLIIARLLDSLSVNGVIGLISEITVFGLIFCFVFFLHKIILWSFDSLNEPKVDTSSFRVVDGELLALKEPPTFEQWRDKHFAQIKNPYIWDAKKSDLKFTEQELIKIWELCL